MNLAAMRRSQLYNKYFNEVNLKKLIEKYDWTGCIAYQDFFTLLGVEYPDMIRVLDCTWNRQLDETFGLDVMFMKIFPAFHRCEGNIKVYHANAGSVMPDEDFFPKDGDHVVRKRQ